MNKKNFLAIVLIVVALSAKGKGDTLVDITLRLSTSPLKYVSFTQGTLTHLGLDYKIKGNIGGYTEIGVYIPSFQVFQSFKGNTGFSAIQEVKLYNMDRSGNALDYWSVALSYSNQKYTRSDSILPPDDDSYYQEYDEHRQYLGLSFNYGVAIHYKNRFVLGVYVGVGARLNNVENTLTEEEEENRDFYLDWNSPHNWIHKSGTHLVPSVHLGFSIGYLLK